MSTQILHGSGPIRQGDTFDLYILLEEKFDIENKALFVSFKPPGSKEWSSNFIVSDYLGLVKFVKDSPTEIIYDLVDGKSYHTYKFTVTSGLGVTNKYGNLEALVLIAAASNVPVSEVSPDSFETINDVFYNGLIHIYIEKTYGSGILTEISREEYIYLLSEIGNLYKKISSEFISKYKENEVRENFSIRLNEKNSITKEEENLIIKAKEIYKDGKDVALKEDIEQINRDIQDLDNTLKEDIEEVYRSMQDLDNAFRDGEIVVGRAYADANGNPITEEYQTRKIPSMSGPLSGSENIEEVLNRINDLINNLNEQLIKVYNGTTLVGKAKSDEDGNNIKNTYSTKESLSIVIESLNQFKSYVDNSFNALRNGDFIVNKATGDELGRRFVTTYVEVTRLNTLLSDLINGDYVMGKAKADKNGDDIVETYAKKNELVADKIDTSNVDFYYGYIKDAKTLDEMVKNIDTAFDSELYAKLGQANGIATLTSEGKIPSSQLPSYVDDVISYPTINDFPKSGESGKIYVAEDVNKSYRWTGSSYIEISGGLALGETSSTAYAGDKGKKNAADIAELRELAVSTHNDLDRKIAKNAETLKTVDNTKYDILVGYQSTSGEGWVGTPVPNESMVENVYFNTELSVVLQIVDDTNSMFQRRNNLLNKNYKYIGINVGKLNDGIFLYYFLFANDKKYKLNIYKMD
jgi:hypothetical protein